MEGFLEGDADRTWDSVFLLGKVLTILSEMQCREFPKVSGTLAAGGGLKIMK